MNIDKILNDIREIMRNEKAWLEVERKDLPIGGQSLEKWIGANFDELLPIFVSWRWPAFVKDYYSYQASQDEVK